MTARSILTDEEAKALDAAGGLDHHAPFLIQGVGTSQFSIARHYGGCKAYGRPYIYHPPTDELIRADVLRWLRRRRKRLADSGAEQVEMKL